MLFYEIILKINNQFNMEQMGPHHAQSQEMLTVIQSARQLQESSREQFHSLVGYKKQGSQFNLYVSDLYLQQRVNKIGQVERQEIHQDLLNQNEANKSAPRKHPPRYFQPSPAENQIRYAKCFRCGKKGHAIRHCPLPLEQISCIFCLGDHLSSNCNTKNCFQCNQPGHIARQCRASRVNCRKCGNKGHIEQDCGVIVFLNSSTIRCDRDFRDRYGLADLARIRCLAGCRYPIGHFNCHRYDNIHKEFYTQASIEKTIFRENYLLSRVNKLREIYFKQQVARIAQQKRTEDGKKMEEREEEDYQGEAEEGVTQP